MTTETDRVGEIGSKATGTQASCKPDFQSQWVAISPGDRAAHADIARNLGRFAKQLDRTHEDLLALRNDPAAAGPWIDWYIDNEYLIRRVLQRLRRDLSASFVAHLPRLISGPAAGAPRVQDMARVVLDLSELKFDQNVLEVLVLELRDSAPLNTAELWAFPLFLQYQAMKLIQEEVYRRINDLKARAEEEGMVDTDRRDVVADCIQSLHRLQRTNWQNFFERTSQVELLLGLDPAGAYKQMDFATRDRYRTRVEQLARRSQLDELAVARCALELANDAQENENNNAASTGHVGYFLIGDGYRMLEEKVAVKPPVTTRLRRWAVDHRLRLYFSALTVVATVLFALPTFYSLHNGHWLQAIPVMLVVIVPALILASVLINWQITLWIPPRVLPKMDFSRGIPSHHRTAVCIALLIGQESDIQNSLEQLEKHYLANPDHQLRFGILTGLFDAPEATTQKDQRLLTCLDAGIANLNKRYEHEGLGPFFWMHRARCFASHEAIWMEWERKRGKLKEFNHFLLTGELGSFTHTGGDIEWLRQVQYVITLDADTVLPVRGAQRLIGTIAHPLNQPVWDEKTGEVLSGFSILQPRIEINPITATRNIFTRIFSGDRGLDLYTLAVSDAYQDLFGEGIFTGKGLYHVGAFVASLRNAVPEGAVLSHDLFEGIHGRTALVSDAVMYEEYPPEYLSFSRRLHRWVRGDWQLLPWLWPMVPSESGEKMPNRLSVLHRWQLTHNLLRSLQAPWLLLLLFLGWFALPGSPLHWTVLALITLLVPSLTGVVGLAHATIRRRRSSEHVRNLKGDLKRWILAVAFLPQEATTTVDAIFRSVYRTYVSHRHLLEWSPAALEAGRSNVSSLGQYWRSMGAGPAIAIITAAVLAATTPSILIFAAPILLLWLASPQLAYLARQDRTPPMEKIRLEDRTHLRRLARRTWYFFERFVGPEDHWLPPDHFQEDPKGVVAHRTSPTNIGLLLVSNLTAYDQGYIDAQELVIRSRNTLRTLSKLPRFRGHIHNWCDTQHLTTLPPAYVSTVDSGNLLGSLLTLKQGLLGISQDKAWRFGHFEGLLDTVGVLEDSLEEYPSTEPRNVLAKELIDLRRLVMAAAHRPEQWPDLIGELEDRLNRHVDPAVQQVLREPKSLPPEILADLRLWLERSHHHIKRMKQSRDQFLPWWSRPEAKPDIPASEVSSAQKECWEALSNTLVQPASFAELVSLPDRLEPALSELMLDNRENTLPEATRQWLTTVAAQIREAGKAAVALIKLATELADTCELWFESTDLAFLYDREKKVFRIGYNVDQGKLDENAYDLLASEARLASFLAIAKGEVSADHWIHLGRPLTREQGQALLLSWSGTMFEYLMPQLMMREPATTLLGQSGRIAIDHQIRYASRHGRPWGISECGYSLLDGAQNYAYHAFGAPELSLRSNKGAEDWVITPYATFLALLWRPQAAFDNLRRLEKMGMLGRYGFFEAVDFTERRVEVGRTYSIVRSYMAHHHGMSLVSLGIALCAENAISRFSRDPRVEACELILQERVALDADVEYPTYSEQETLPSGLQQVPPVTPWQVPLDSPTPRVHLLSNGRLSVRASSRGAGGTNWKSDAITRWRPDPTQERWGNWIYLQDRDSWDLWSITRAPLSGRGIRDSVRFYSHCVEYKRQDQNLVQTLEVTVSPWHDVELRRISLTNHGDKTRNLRLTSYAEMVIADPRADSQHPAFGNLFVHSEFLADRSLLIFERRTRDPKDQAPVVGECLIGRSGIIAPTAIETDRAKFIGRGGSYAHPSALEPNKRLSGSLGYTLDPVSALQTDVDLEPGASVQLAYLRFVGDSRKDVLALAARFAFWPRVQRTFEEGESQACHDLWRNKLSNDDFRKVIALNSALICYPPQLRAPVPVLSANRLQQANLWGVGISGDFPIILVRVGREADVDTAHLLLKAHSFWRKRNLKVDLVLLNIGDSGYEGTTQDTLRRLLAQHSVEAFVGGRGGIFPLTADSLGTEEVVLLETAAKMVLDASGASLTHALQSLERWESPLPRFRGKPPSAVPFDDHKLEPINDLHCFNGHGGFSADGREYVISVRHRRPTPAPWINVIANPFFGTIVSESGGGYTWFQNSGENRLTSWRNDPVLDEPSECLYLRDEETGVFWSATAKPVPHESEYRTRHGAGYSCFEHVRHGIHSEMTIFVPPEDPIKIVRVVLRNLSSRNRRVTGTYYAEWVLGTRREDTSPYLQPAFLPERRALITANPYNPDWPNQIAFLATDQPVHGYTTDRTEFIGRSDSLGNPAALKRVGLNKRVEPGRDPCGALQIHVDLPPNSEHIAVFFLGAAQDFESAVALIDHYRQPAAFDTAWQASQNYWHETLNAVTLDSPDESVNFIFNQWLIYQTLACRMFGRSGLYQSSGAFGFRDQLQDSMALLHTRPEVCRNQILAAAARQFPEGDVLHWWHPPHARGVRTRISDDLVWLPLVVSEYLQVTEDFALLDEQVPWLSGEPLADGEAERYAHFEVSDDEASVYDHCLRILERANRLGPHGIPLIGGGDWNDGMNRVGLGGRGESVWMGWFLIVTLQRFSRVATGRGDQITAENLAARADHLAQKLNQNAWDGNWYRRAYYDDGTPMGSAGKPACEIDSIPQSWSVLSEVADTARTKMAMEAVWTKLVRPDPGQVLLFTPPFRGRGKGQPDPGYIAAYPPGVRENGGQYTHAACWAGMAFAALGDAEKTSAVLDCLNPVNHGDSEARIGQYQVEPYVLAADIYGEAPHIGRGGWTWYTGSAGWLYRFILEGVLGIRRVGNELQVKPCLPPQWPGYTLRYRYGQTVYRITVKRRSEGLSQVEQHNSVSLIDDGKRHDITIEI